MEKTKHERFEGTDGVTAWAFEEQGGSPSQKAAEHLCVLDDSAVTYHRGPCMDFNPTVLPASRLVRFSICVFMVACVGFFVVRTIDWPLVNDPAQIDYVCFLMDQGRAPYRDIIEMNMPGTYLVNWTVMHTLGGGALAWRLFDLSLMAAAGIAMLVIAWPTGWLGGFLAAVLLILFHGRDGPGQQGQRDLIMAVLLVGGWAFLFHGLRRRQTWPWFFFGVCAMIAVTIKPTPLPFVVLLLCAAVLRLQRGDQPFMLPLLASLGGMLVPIVIVSAFLLREHAAGPFLHVVCVVLPFYADLGRRDLTFLLKHCLTPSLEVFLLLAAAVAVVVPRWRDWESNMLLLGVAWGLFSFFSQGKGFPYQRYPLVAFLFLWAGLKFTSALDCPGTGRMLGLAGIFFAVSVAPQYAARACHRQWRGEFITSLSADLYRLGGQRLSGHVQCLSVPADCDTVLYRMKLLQATGLTYDFFIFGSPTEPVVQEYRDQFLREIQRTPPTVFVVGEGLFPDDTDDYQKLQQWPQLRDYLGDYVRYDQREFTHSESGYSGFRVYVRKLDHK